MLVLGVIALATVVKTDTVSEEDRQCVGGRTEWARMYVHTL